MSKLGVGATVRVARGEGIRGRIVEVRDDAARCTLESGPTVWVTWAELSEIEGPPPESAAMKPPASGATPLVEGPGTQNPYQASMVEPVALGPDERDLKWLLFSFEGRIPRSKYWFGTAILLATALGVGIVAAILIALVGGDSGDGGAGVSGGAMAVMGLLGLLMIPYLWSSLAISVKRWHDRGKSGFWVLIGLIPYIGGIWAFIETGCLAGDPSPNAYGPPLS